MNRTIDFGGWLSIGVVQTNDFGDYLLNGNVRTIDFGGWRSIGIVQTIDFGDCLLIGVCRQLLYQLEVSRHSISGAVC